MNTHRSAARSRFFPRVLLLGLLLALLSAALSTAEEPTVASTELILSASEFGYPPFCIATPDGQVDGFSVELLRAAAGAMGREVVFRVGPWHEVRGWLERGDVEALPLVGRTPEREAIFDFTFPYLTMHGAIVVRDDVRDVEDLNDLRGRRVAVMRGDNAEEYLRRTDRGLDLITTDTFEDALRLLSQGESDAVVIQRLVAVRLLQEMGLPNLRIVDRPIMDFRQDFAFAVREGDKDTLALLNEGLALVMADGTYRHLHAKWFAALELPSERPLIVGGDWSYPPFEYLDEKGLPAGFNVDLTRAIARELGLDVEIRLAPWSDVIRDLEMGSIDAIQGMLYSPQRDLRFDFTQPYMVTYYISVVRKGEREPPTELADLKGMRILVERDDLAHDYLREQGLEAQVTALETHEDALWALVDGHGDCAILARVSVLELLERRGWENLELAPKPLFSGEYGFAVRGGQQALLAQFSEGLRVIKQSGEYREIYEQWLGVYEPQPVSLGTILRYVAMVAGPLLLILLGSLTWSRTLRREVARQTDELRRRELQFRDMLEGAPDPVFVEVEGRFAYVNQAFMALLGASSSEDFVGMAVLERIAPDVRGRAVERWRLIRRDRREVPRVEETFLRLDGTRIETEIAAVPVRFMGHDGTLVFVRDITERRRSEEEIQRQLKELRRWQMVMLNREERIRELKQQINALHSRLGEPLRYPSQQT